MAASSSSAPALSVAQHNKPEYTNWLALGHALTTVLCQGLRPFVNREMKTFYNNVKAGLVTASPCTCVHVPRRRPNQYHDMSTCAWANVLQNYHDANKPNWKQSDTTKWLDPNLGPWEIAKLFLPDLSGHAVINSADDMDVTGILNLMYWCTHFTVHEHLIKDVRDIRNNKWVHVPKLELTDADKTTAFDAVENLLKDPILVHDPDAQRALLEIHTLQCVSDLNNFQAQILTRYKAMIEEDILGLRRDIKQLKRESRSNQKLKKQIKQMENRLRNMQNSLEDANSRISIGRNFKNAYVVKNSALCLCKYLFKCTRIDKRLLIPWLMVLLLCSMVTILDPRSYKDGCPEEDTSVPFETKDINMSEHLIAAQAENFIGRQWLYREVENMFENDDLSGVLILGNPGAGKSALSSQLICSRTTSSRINSHILGYHFCKYSDKNTQMAGTFVRNVAEMIARRLPEYGYLVSNKSYIQRSFETDCIQNQDPVGCFEQTIVSPLRNLKNKPPENWYIVLDALDECLSQGETSHSIVYLLNNKIHRFPPWLKLIMTSRNESDASLHSSKIKTFVIDPEDSRNIQDIDLFLVQRFYQESRLSYWIRSWLGDDSVDSTSKLIKVLLSKSQGNFLFVKEVLKHWEFSRHELKDAYSLPKTLGDLYHSYFERLYPFSTGEKSFNSVRRVLELLVATFEPLTQKEIFEILKMNEKSLDEEYNVRSLKNRLNKLGHFLRFGENDTVTLYHLSLTEWLTDDRNDKFFISKRKGHEMFCDYYFALIRDKGERALSKYFLTLAEHIAYGGLKEKEAYVKEFLNFPSQTVNSSDPHSNRTLLHLAATINSTQVLELLSRHFSHIDGVDSRGMTPAFLAAQHGLVDNLALLVKRGANVNRKTKSIIAVQKSETRAALKEAQNKTEFHGFDLPHIEMPVHQSKSKFFNATMIHAAAKGGHLNVIRFLLENNVIVSKLNGVNLTAIQLAAENGHLEVVKTLFEAGAAADQTALHHAAENNRLEVVKFLLGIGVKDACLRCDGSFYWLKTKRRFQQRCSQMKDIVATLEHWIQSDEAFWEDLSGIEEIFDDKHLIYCHSALHAAVASGHDKVVSRLLSEEHNALHCHDYTGRTPLHEAIRKNHSKIVKILLEKEQKLINYKCEHWQHIGSPVFQHHTNRFLHEMLSIDEFNEYHADICHCGYTPLHLAARYGHVHLGVSLIREGARVNEGDCSGARPFHVAACHNQLRFISMLCDPRMGGDINSKTQNGSIPLHSAAICGAVQAIDHLLQHGANISAVDDFGLTALHYAIIYLSIRSQFGSEFSHFGQGVLMNDSWTDGTFVLHEIDRMGNFLGFYRITGRIENITLHAFRERSKLITLFGKGSNVDVVDISGQTPLHIAAMYGLAYTVIDLLYWKASVDLRDNLGKTPLELAVENAPQKIGNHYDTAHWMVVNFLLTNGASIGECNLSGSSLLHKAIINQQPLIVKELLLKGASLTCKDSFGRTPLITYLQNGGDWIDVIINAFTTSVDIKCGEPLNSSVFHLLSYHTPTVADDNFFVSSACKFYNAKKCKVKKGSLAEKIDSHPKKHEIINSCLDAEGFTPLHRAAQGGNVVAINYLLENGADDTILSPEWLDALTTAVLYTGKNTWQLYGDVYVPERIIGISPTSDAAIKLLHHSMLIHGYQVKCNVNRTNLTLYHLAATRGLANLTEILLQERDPLQLDVNCPNKDGITPLYLAKIFENGLSGPYLNPWDRVMNAIQSHGGEMRYPSKDVEYNVIFNRLYGWIPEKFMLDLRPDVRLFIASLLTLYEKVENNSFLCTYGYFDYGAHLLLSQLWSIYKEITELFNTQRSMCSGDDHFLAMEDILWWNINRCGWKQIKLADYSSRFGNSPGQTYPRNIGSWKNWENASRNQRRNWFQKELRFLMQLRRMEVSGSFACLKSLYFKLKPFMHSERLKFLIKQYEKRPPSSYLTRICQSFMILFKDYLSHHKPKSGMPFFSMVRDDGLDFVKKRMKIYSRGSSPHPEFDAFSTFGDGIKWPLEFLVKRFLGLFQRYDYLKTLHVGMDKRTQETEKLEKMWSRLKST